MPYLGICYVRAAWSELFLWRKFTRLLVFVGKVPNWPRGLKMTLSSLCVVRYRFHVPWLISSIPDIINEALKADVRISLIYTDADP